MATRCSHCEFDLTSDKCVNNLSTAERGSTRKRHTTLVDHLRKAWKKGRSVDLVDLKAKRLDLCELYEKASGINFHCQLAQPERAKEFEEWQIAFDHKHSDVLASIDLELQEWPDLDLNPKPAEISKSKVDPNEDSYSHSKPSEIVVQRTAEQMFAQLSGFMATMNSNIMQSLAKVEENTMQSLAKVEENTLQSLAKVEDNTLQTLSKQIMEVEERTIGIVDTRLTSFKISVSDEVGKLREEVAFEIGQIRTSMAEEVGRTVAGQLHGVIEESQKTAKRIRDLSGEIKSSRDQMEELEKRALAFKESNEKAMCRNLDEIWSSIDLLLARVSHSENKAVAPEIQTAASEDAAKVTCESPVKGKAGVELSTPQVNDKVNDHLSNGRISASDPIASTPFPNRASGSNDVQGKIGAERRVDFSTRFLDDPSFERRSRNQDNSHDVLSATAELIDLINRGSLPPLPLSKFDGSLKEYPMFKANFMARVHNKCTDDGMRLAYLNDLLESDVKRVVADCIRDPNKYSLIWDRLDEEFGRPKFFRQAHVNDMLELPSIKPNDHAGLKKFSVTLHTHVSALVKEGLTMDLKSIGNISRVVSKLPLSLREAWSRFERKIEADGKEVDLTHFNDWLKQKVLDKDMSTLMYGLEGDKSSDKSKVKGQPKAKSGSHAATINHINTSEPVVHSQPAKPRHSPTLPQTPARPVIPGNCFVCKGAIHSLKDCTMFTAKSPTDRLNFIIGAGRCVRCLTGRGHTARDCPKKATFYCRAADCTNRNHHSMLHGAKWEKRAPEPVPRPATVPAAAPPVEAPFVGAVSYNEQPKQSRTMLAIVPVTLLAGSRKVDTYAFLDPGASTTMIRSDTAKKMLGLDGPVVTTRVAWFDGSEKEVDAKVVTFDICNRDQSVKFRAYDAYAVDEIHMASNVALDQLPIHEWDHVKGLKFTDVSPEQITVVVAYDIEEAHDRIETRRAPSNTFRPAAHLTHFGWVLAGRRIPPGIREPRLFVGHINVYDRPRAADENTLAELLQQFWTVESKQVVTGPVLSADDKRGLNILESTIKNIGNRYEVGLMWASDQVKLPDNRKAALRRLFQQERRFERDPEYARQYHAAIQEYITLGHARYLSKEEAAKRTDRTNYLTHFGVVKETSNTTKVRVVFDGAAECDGTSLNDHLLRGPNLLTNLFGVLLRARMHRVAVGSDIAKMYLQVKVPEHEQDAYRFLYHPPGSDSPPLTLRMRVHVFGSKSSPSTCIYALNRTAEDNRVQFPNAADYVTSSFYVDNFWASFPSEEEAVQVAFELKDMLARGGFNLREWTSNSRAVLAKLAPLGLTNKKSELDLEPLDMERTLGLHWDRENDTYTFQIQRKFDKEWHPTRREFLSAILSVFDPLGFLAPMIFVMKVLMQKVCSQKVSFDGKIPLEYLPEFRKWFTKLKQVEKVQVPRCFTSSERAVVSRQLHIFTDASNLGYGAVAYVRSTLSTNEVQVAFAIAKTHVAPNKKKQTIPRLELLGAMEGLLIAHLITRELKIDMKTVTFHTDSQIVLRWINSKSCKFELFVENRIGKIVQDTDRHQWRFVPGIQNPADLCSRGLQPDNLSELEKFHQGPEFLRLKPEAWPKWAALESDHNQVPEILHINTIAVKVEDSLLDKWMAYHSQLMLIQRRVAWCLRFARNARSKHEQRCLSNELQNEELERALMSCIRRAQECEYASEMHALRLREHVPVKSDLLRLTPFMDDSNVMRVGGRLKFAPLDYEARHPIILPASHPVTTLIVRTYHVNNYHVKTERLLADLRHLYWIPKGRRVVKSIISKCVICRKIDARTQTPLMAPLPEARLTPHVAPFTFTGIDFFGPLTVSMGGRGRRLEKRWVCLFTCLTVRAVHLVVCHGLSADEFLLALSQFISVRGRPREIFSDNGTNFTATERELQLDRNASQIKWHFSPPLAPHFGGSWERLVQSSKRMLKVALGNETVNDQVLRTVVGEVSAMLNSRPLTHLSLNPDDDEPLTPNHFIHGHSRPYLPVLRSDMSNPKVSLKQYQHSQAVLDQMWKRWMVEYLPELQVRSKWTATTTPPTVGDVVLVPDPLNSRGQWPTAQVTELLPSADGVVRTVKILTQSGRELVRAVAKIVPLVKANQ